MRKPDHTRRLCLYCRQRRALKRFGYSTCSLTCARMRNGYNREYARIDAERRNRERAEREFIKEIVRATATPEGVAAFNAKYATN
jgi:hypothetical protein